MQNIEYAIPSYPRMPDLHPTHKMSPWKTEVLYSYRGPNLYTARQCKHCGGIQGKSEFMNLMDDALTSVHPGH